VQLTGVYHIFSGNGRRFNSIKRRHGEGQRITRIARMNGSPICPIRVIRWPISNLLEHGAHS